ncbi:hypothetical protein Gasu2_42000 [Galdieria sulphuraria]|nr:hypothetical protein Gasu2_42000 [Galdieria sulphuraria]
MVEYISVLCSYIEPFLWALAQVLVEHVFAYSILYLCLFVLGFETSRGYLAFQDKAISRAIFWVTMLTLTLELRNVPRKYCILFSRTISLYLVSLVVGSVVFIFPWIALLHALLIQLWTGSNELGGTLNELFDYQVHVLFTCIPWFLLFAYAFTIDFHFDTKYFWKLWKQLERKHENGTHAVILLLLFYLLKQLCISFVSIGSHSTNSKTLDSHQEQLTTPMEVGQISEQNNSNRKEEQIVTPVLEAVSPRTKASIEEWTANCSEEERFKSLYQQALRESPKKWNLLLDSYLLREGELSDGDDLDRSFSNDVKQVTARFQQYRNPDVVSISSLAQAIQGTSKSEYIKRNVDP